jgi:hypothetical protein
MNHFVLLPQRPFTTESTEITEIIKIEKLQNYKDIRIFIFPIPWGKGIDKGVCESLFCF